MADTRPSPISRRLALAMGLAALPAHALAARGKVVTILGDFITAGLGLPGRDALPNQLHLALEKLGVPNMVRGAGVSGETTAGGVGAHGLQHPAGHRRGGGGAGRQRSPAGPRSQGHPRQPRPDPARG